METAVGMEIVVHGRNVVVPDHFRNTWPRSWPRSNGMTTRSSAPTSSCITNATHGRPAAASTSRSPAAPAARWCAAEACAEDFYKALDLAAEKLERRFRQAADRRRVHHGRRTPPSVARSTAEADCR